jgi:hypothetical protein
MLIGPALISCSHTICHECREGENSFCVNSTNHGIQQKQKYNLFSSRSNQTLSKDTNDIIKAHIDACSVLLNRTDQTSDQIIVEKEIADLKMVLDLVKYVS